MALDGPDLIDTQRKSLKDLHIDTIEQQGGEIYEVQPGDTLWGIVEQQLGITDHSKIANSIIEVTKINQMNDTIKQDTLSVIDGKTIHSPDGIPGDYIIAGEKIILKLKPKEGDNLTGDTPQDLINLRLDMDGGTPTQPGENPRDGATPTNPGATNTGSNPTVPETPSTGGSGNTGGSGITNPGGSTPPTPPPPAPGG